MKKQVDKSHYNFSTYMSKGRWISTWHQLKEVIDTHPESILEIGPGAGIFTTCAKVYGLSVKTLDLDPELQPDYTGSADNIPLADNSVDTVCAFQVLEHMPFEHSLKALAECCRVARKAVILSLPDAARGWDETINFPYLRTLRFVLRNPFARRRIHVFNGEHYWEINKQGYKLVDVITQMRRVAQQYDIRTFRVHENLYHRFFVFTKLLDTKNHLPSTSRLQISP